MSISPSSEETAYIEVDVSDWLPAGTESVGTKPKRWLRDPESDIRWLMKDATHNTRADGTSSRKGDDWAERIATGVADRLGLPAARTEMAVRHGPGEIRLGVLSKEVLHTGEALVLGNELLERPAGRHDREGYTLNAVRQALGDVAAPPGTGGELSAWDVFAGYLVLDALIGNTDRHEQNWAVIVRATSRHLSPSFDHASSLGFQLEDAERVARLSTNDSCYTPEYWAGRARTKFAGKPFLVEAALEARGMQRSEQEDRWLSRCEDVDRLIEPIWLVPQHRMSEPAREFAERVLRRNRERLLAN